MLVCCVWEREGEGRRCSSLACVYCTSCGLTFLWCFVFFLSEEKVRWFVVKAGV